MREQDLKKRKESLEIQHLKLQQELAELDHLMRLAGFSNGLETVKATAQELMRYREEDFPEEDYAA